MLTTQTSDSVRQNVVTDIRVPTDANANVELNDPTRGKRVLSPEAAILLNSSIVARPLMVPEVCSVHIKNTEYRYRWVNFAGRNGQIYMQRRAQGFVNATPEDVDVLGGDVTKDSGEIKAGDVILMKIRADLYDAAMKFNMEKAMVLQRTRGMYLKGGSADVHSDEKAVARTIEQDIPAKAHGKTSSFIPSDPDALLKASAALGGVELARAQEKEIREKIKADNNKSA